jgi:hypothetical protein
MEIQRALALPPQLIPMKTALSRISAGQFPVLIRYFWRCFLGFHPSSFIEIKGEACNYRYEGMKNKNELPSTVSEDEYLSLGVVSFIFGVGARQTRTIAKRENIEKTYYSSTTHCDLVCYRSIDVYRVAVGRRNIWPDPWPKEYLKDFVKKKDTYASFKNEMFNIHQQKEMNEFLKEDVVDLTPADPEAPSTPLAIPTEFFTQFAQLTEAVIKLTDQAQTRRRSDKNVRMLQYFATCISLCCLVYFIYRIHNYGS